MKHRFLSCVACLTGLALSVCLSGCAAIPENRGMDVTNQLLATRSTAASGLRPADAQREALLHELLSQPLDAQRAVHLALLNNQRINVLYAQLGLATAEIYDASRLSNPSLGYARLSGDGAVKTTWSVSQRFTELLFLQLNTRIARSSLLQTQQRVAQQVLSLEAEVLTAWYRMTTAELSARVAERVAMAADTAAQYAQSLYDAGNISELQWQRELLAASQARLQQRLTAGEALAARGAMLDLLGVSFDEPQVRFATHMTLPQAAVPEVATLQALARQQRLDIAATRQALQHWQWALNHTHRWRWFRSIEVGVERERDSNAAAMTGPAVSLELPMFNQGKGALTRAEAQVESLTAELQMLELATNNGLVVQLAAMRAAAANVEDYRQRLLPLQQRIVTLTQQQQNYMLVGTLELINARQLQFALYQDYLHAVRDYWLALVELAQMTGGYRGLLESAADDALTMLDSGDAQSPPAAHGGAPMQSMSGMDDDAPRNNAEPDTTHQDHASHGGVQP